MSSNDPEVYGDYSVDDETQLSAEDTLDDPDVDDELDRGYSPPESYSAAQRFGNTPYEEESGESLDQRIAQEDPEPDPYGESDTSDESEDDEHEVGDLRAGRLIASGDEDEIGEDLEQDMFGEDVGIDGAAASAEEAAMHIIDEEDEQA